MFTILTILEVVSLATLIVSLRGSTKALHKRFSKPQPANPLSHHYMLYRDKAKMYGRYCVGALMLAAAWAAVAYLAGITSAEPSPWATAYAWAHSAFLAFAAILVGRAVRHHWLSRQYPHASVGEHDGDHERRLLESAGDKGDGAEEKRKTSTESAIAEAHVVSGNWERELARALNRQGR